MTLMSTTEEAVADLQNAYDVLEELGAALPAQKTLANFKTALLSLKQS